LLVAEQFDAGERQVVGLHAASEDAEARRRAPPPAAGPIAACPLMMRAAQPTASGSAGAPTSRPSRIRHTPKGAPSRRQAFAICM
jgi:hypothetical protein